MINDSGKSRFAKEILKDHRKKQEEKKIPAKMGAAYLTIMWKQKVGDKYGGFIGDFTEKERGQLKSYITKAGEHAAAAMGWALDNWGSFSFEAKKRSGLLTAPDRPHIGFLLAHYDVAIDCKNSAIAGHSKTTEKLFVASKPAEKVAAPIEKPVTLDKVAAMLAKLEAKKGGGGE
jgi:hypothetical protein